VQSTIRASGEPRAREDTWEMLEMNGVDNQIKQSKLCKEENFT